MCYQQWVTLSWWRWVPSGEVLKVCGEVGVVTKSIAECLQTEMGSLWLIFTGGWPTAPYTHHRWVRLHLDSVVQIESRLTCRALPGIPHTHVWGLNNRGDFLHLRYTSSSTLFTVLAEGYGLQAPIFRLQLLNKHLGSESCFPGLCVCVFASDRTHAR